MQALEIVNCHLRRAYFDISWNRWTCNWGGWESFFSFNWFFNWSCDWKPRKTVFRFILWNRFVLACDCFMCCTCHSAFRKCFEVEFHVTDFLKIPNSSPSSLAMQLENKTCSLHWRMALAKRSWMSSTSYTWWRHQSACISLFEMIGVYLLIFFFDDDLTESLNFDFVISKWKMYCFRWGSMFCQSNTVS